MADIFGYKRNPKPRSVFSTEDSFLTFGGTDVGFGGDGSAALGYLVQQWQTQYQQQVTELFEIGTNALYWTKGRPVGNGAVGRIIGQQDATSANPGTFFPQSAYDICDGGALVEIQAASGACEGQGTAGVAIKMDGVVVTSIGFAMQVRDVMLNENIGWRFASLEIDGIASPAG